MPRRPVLVQQPLEEEDDGDDPLPALMAGILLIMTCGDCGGTGVVGNAGRCPCRAFGNELALTFLKEEGYIQ